MARPAFDELITDALQQPFKGWDFSYIADRIEVDDEPWDYRGRVKELAARARAFLDIGTGGGEFVASLRRLPPLAVATESWPPNVPVAAHTLRAVGAYVVADEGSADNADQDPTGLDGRLPFRSETFDVVIDRHTAFRATEVARVLRRDGTFLTQQVGGRNEAELNEALGIGPPYKSPTLAEYVGQLESGGLEVVEATQAFPVKRYLDVGAIVYNANAIPWQFPGLDISTDNEQLWAIHNQIEANGAFVVHHHRLLLEARRP